MAKRYNVSIPDALAERLEPHKDKISLSAIMQAALERELAQLSLTDEQKQHRSSLRAAAANAWLKRNPFIAEALSSFAEDLLDQAINDGLSDLFVIYRKLYIRCRRDELIKKLSSNVRYFGSLAFQAPEEREAKAGEALDYAGAYGDEDSIGFVDSFEKYLAKAIKEKKLSIPVSFYSVEEGGCIEFEGAFRDVITSYSTHEMALNIINDHLRSRLSDQDIEHFILDFEAAFAKIETGDGSHLGNEYPTSLEKEDHE